MIQYNACFKKVARNVKPPYVRLADWDRELREAKLMAAYFLRIAEEGGDQ